mgnify:CR=1 FL=1
MANLLVKVLAVRFLIEAEENAKEKSEVSIERLRYLNILFSKFINMTEEKALFTNCQFWVTEIALLLP